MKKAKEYLIGCEHDGSFIPVEEVNRLIKLAQEDAIRETVKECIKCKIPDYLNGGERISEQSILSVADKLIKEL